MLTEVHSVLVQREEDHEEWMEWCKYDFIDNGYRKIPMRFKECARSVFQCHTETVNIWTHIAWFFAVLLTWTPRNAWFLAFKVALLACALASVVFHTFHNMHPYVFQILQLLDHLTVQFTIYTGCMSLISTAHEECGTENTELLNVLCSALCVLFLVALCLSSYCSQGGNIMTQSLIFVLSVVMHSAPFWEYVLIRDVEVPSELVVAMAFLIISVTLYGFSVPERFCRSTCVYVCYSHIVFHILVAVASLLIIVGGYRIKC